MGADAPRHGRCRLRHAKRPARRRQGVRRRHGDGHGGARRRRARPRPVPRDAVARPVHGCERLSAAPRHRRDRRRPVAARRSPAPARPDRRTQRELQVSPVRPRERLRLRRPARRAGVRPARVHAPRLDHGFARRADQPPLGRFDAYQRGRRHRRRGRRRGQGRGVGVPRPRARPAPLRHRDAAARTRSPSARA